MTRQRLLALINYDINQRMRKITHPILLYDPSFSYLGVICRIYSTSTLIKFGWGTDINLSLLQLDNNTLLHRTAVHTQLAWWQTCLKQDVCVLHFVTSYVAWFSPGHRWLSMLASSTIYHLLQTWWDSVSHTHIHKVIKEQNRITLLLGLQTFVTVVCL